MATVPTSSGADPFDYSDDTVSARMTFDVPADAVQNLDAVVRRAQDLRVAMEASSRAQGNVVTQLQEMPHLLDVAAEAQNRYQSALVIRTGNGDPNTPLSGRNNPVPVGDSGRQTGELSGTIGADEVESALDDLEERDPRQARNMRAQRNQGAGTRPSAPARPGSGRPRSRPDSAPRPAVDTDPESNGPSGDDDEFVDTRQNRLPGTRPQQPQPDSTDPVQRAEDLARRGQGYVNQILQETRAGQTGMGNANAGLRAVRGGASMASEAIERRALAAHIAEGGTAESFRGAAAGGGRMGTLASGVGAAAKVAGVAGVAYTAAAATQSIGEQYQGYKNMGSIQGEGAGAGFGYEMQIRSMAMNPFLNTEQARQVVTQALSQGYDGGSQAFDNVTDFMADNLKNMNLQVADSVKLLQTNVTEGGQSISGLADQLNTMKGLSQEGFMTLPQRQQAFQQVSGQAIETGLGGQEAGEYANLTTGLFSEDKQLSPLGPQIGTAAATNTSLQFSLINRFGLQGTPPAMALSAAIEKVGEDAAVEGILGELQNIVGEDTLRMASSEDPTAKNQAISAAQARLRLVGISLSPNETAAVLAKMAEGSFVGQAAEEREKISEQEQKIEYKGGRGGTPGMTEAKSIGASVGGDLRTIGSALNDTVGIVTDFFGWTDGENDYSDTKESMKKTNADFDNSSALYKNERVQQLVSQYGPKNIKVGDGKGGVEDLDQDNKEQIEKLVKGDYQVSLEGGKMQSLKDAVASANNAAAGQGAGGVTDVNIKMSPETARFFQAQTSGRSPNQQSADTGVATSQNNNPEPSENKPWNPLSLLGGN